MSHPDLNELRKQVTEFKSGGKKRSRPRTRKKWLFILILLVCLSYLYLFKWETIKGTYTISHDYVVGLIEKTGILGGVKVKGKQEVVMLPMPSQDLFITAKGANIRSEADLTSEIVTVAGEQERLSYLFHFQKNEDVFWLEVETESGKKGWISDKIVEWDQESIHQLKVNAEKNAAAMLELGRRFEEGIANEQNLADAFAWYKKAADYGDHEAQFTIGWFYQQGLGIEKNLKEALIYYELSAEQGNSKAMNNAALLYGNGLGAKENGKRSRQWLEKAIEYKEEKARTNLAVLYLQGRDRLKIDFEKGMSLLLEAEKNGDTKANDIMEMYRNNSKEEFLRLVAGDMSLFQLVER
jgi:TPR repeat protein